MLAKGRLAWALHPTTLMLKRPSSIPGAAVQPLACGYQPRDSKQSVLRAAVSESLATLLREAAGGHGLPRFVQQDFERFVSCGVLSEGFTRLKCDDCGKEMLVGFSCKSRGVCPSCCSRRAHDTASHLVGHVLPEVEFRRRGRDGPFEPPPAQIRASGTIALGSHLGS